MLVIVPPSNREAEHHQWPAFVHPDGAGTLSMSASVATPYPHQGEPLRHSGRAVKLQLAPSAACSSGRSETSGSSTDSSASKSPPRDARKNASTTA